MKNGLFAREHVLCYDLFPIVAKPDHFIFEEVNKGFLISVRFGIQLVSVESTKLEDILSSSEVVSPILFCYLRRRVIPCIQQFGLGVKHPS